MSDLPADSSAIATSTENKPVVALRPAQEQILAYTGGPMGISAVPGSGKTFILSLLAAKLVARMAAEGAPDESEVLVVTYTNSAVDNFEERINAHLRAGARRLLPGVGYSVRTLHGLAHDIVRERPGLVGLADDFEIIDQRTAQESRRDRALAWLRSNPEALLGYIHPDWLNRIAAGNQYFQRDMVELATGFIGIAKNLRATPEELRRLREQQRGNYPLIDFGIEVYSDYQRMLQQRGAVDFDDLVVLAVRALEADSHYLERLQDRWHYVLEDEAQDSSRLQEEMLRLLTRKHGNWVRVGDPNQSIFSSFTSASAHYLRRFMEAHPKGARELPNSGRSALPIIRSANFLIDWSQTLFPDRYREEALQLPHIEPTPPDDPQPNPPPGEPAIYLHNRPLSADGERDVVLKSLGKWMEQNPDRTVAILAPDNNYGFKFVDLLEAAGVPFDDSLLRSDAGTRAGAAALSVVVNYLAQPQNVRQLVDLWSGVWWPLIGEPLLRSWGDAEKGVVAQRPLVRPRKRRQKLPEPVERVAQALSRLREPEEFIFPESEGEAWELVQDWLEETPNLRKGIARFREDLRRWSLATVLPIGELLITIGNDLFRDPADLALAHRLAVLLDKIASDNPAWRLLELGGELDNVAQNRRRVTGFAERDEEFVARAGVVTVGTMHSAKGLEWDRVYLTSVNTYSFPSGATGDAYRAEAGWARDKLNIAAEMKEQVELLVQGSLDPYVQGKATEDARYALAGERLRLLYVGITRARRELIITYNIGRDENRPLAPALAFEALVEFTEG